jgi:hypothetical protein
MLSADSFAPLRRIVTLLLLSLAGAVQAGPGHDHGDGPAAPTGPAAPRVIAVSDLFELVGIVDGNTMTIYLDRAATNAPIAEAAIDIDAVAGTQTLKLKPEAKPDGTFAVQAPFLSQPGQYAMTFAVTVGPDADVLAGNLEIVDPEAGHDHAKVWWPWAAGGAAAVLVALALLALERRRAAASRVPAATLLLPVLAGLSLIGAPKETQAGPGHDHGDAPAAAGGNSPRRLPDGHVFLPKPSQRQLAVRTAVVEESELPRSVTLMGRVIADPNAGGKVQPTVAGRIEPGPRGLPHLGQRVKRGEVLAVVRAAAGGIERSNQNAAIAELRVARDLAERRFSRLKQLEGSVSQRELEQAQADLDSAAQRLSAVTARDATAEALVAPVSGVIAAVNAVAGQVVDARELVFEIVDPARQRIEAVAFDAALAAGITGAAAAAVSPSSSQERAVSIPLKLIGAGRVLVEGGYPVQFVAAGKDLPPLTVGQPMRVFAQTATRVKGVPVPAGAVVKGPSNEDIVWVKEGAETFGPRVVRFEPVDGATVVVVAGLTAGERVVVQAAPLVNQVR